MSDTASFGEWIRRRRKALDLTREVLAQRVGCAVVTIRKIEADERRPSLQIAERLAECLQIPLVDRAAFLQAARAELAVDRLPAPPEPPLSPPPPRRPGPQPPRQQALKGYELQEPIGSGGFGVVYRATQPGVGREVAVKIIRPEYANHPEFIRRFEAEAQLVARLEHPHIVPLYDYWREPDGAYLVMRFVRGGSLHAALHAHAWALDRCTRMLEQIGAALAFAHRQGIVHRDLKPANILLDDEGNAYLADFGIAKTLLLADAIGQTQPGAIMGSPAYLSPEQLRDEPVTLRSDIYSLGVLLYEVLTGAHPFVGLLPAEQLSKQLYEPLPPLQSIRRDLPDLHLLNAVIQRATAKQPADRYPDALSMLSDWQRSVVSRPMMKDEGQRIMHDGSWTADVATLTDLAVLENPYKGLRAFGEADAADFFGRAALTQRLLERLAEDEEPASAGSIESREPNTGRQADKQVYALQRTTDHGQRTSSRFLAVVGPSGSGKSSVVRAGLIPALRRGALPGSEHWFIVEILPGAYPLEELEAALLRIAVNPPEHLLGQLRDDERGLLRAVKRVLPSEAEAELVLVIDQFEELFTLTQDETIRVHILDSLRTAILDPHSRLRVVVTLRADFYDRPLQYTGFAELVRQRTELVLPLTPSELEQAIVGPAARVGVALAPELVAAVVNDVGEQPGTLPLLQYALTELFEHRQGRMLTLPAYQKSGGVLGTLERRADTIYDSLDTLAQTATRQLFLRLITLGEGIEDTRRRVLRSELLSVVGGPWSMVHGHSQGVRGNGQLTTDNEPSLMDMVIERYGRARLLSFDRDPITREPTVEVAHEALIRIWGRLRAWLDASRADLRLQRLLSIATAEWIAGGRDPSYLLSGARLAQFEALAADSDLALNREERAYLEASLAEWEAQRAREATRAAHEAALERRARMVLRVLVIVLLLATLGAFALTSLTLNQRRVAVRNAIEAQSLALTTGAQLAANRGNSELALALALAANRVPQPVVQAQLTLADLAYTPGIWHRFAGHTDGVMVVAFSPDGKTALSGAADTTMILWDVVSGRVIRRFVGHADWVSTVAFSPDGKTALSGSGGNPTLILWDVATGQIIRRFAEHTSAVTSVAFSPDGKTALSASSDTSLILWDVASGQIIRRFAGHTGAVTSVAFGSDGKTALSGAADTTMILWDVASGQIIRRFAGHTSAVTSVAFNPDGKTVLSGSLDRTLVVWDVATGRPIRHLSGHTDAVNAVAFSPDGKTALSGAGTVNGFFRTAPEQSVILWDVATGQVIRRFEGHTGPVLTVAFSPNGKTALSGSADTTLILWGLASGAEIRRLDGHTDAVNAVAYSPDGKTALSSAADTTLLLWDVASGQLIRRFTAQASIVNAAAFSPDGRTALSGAVDGTLTLWDVGTGQITGRFTGHTSAVTTVVFSPDGKTALSGSLDRTLILWDVASGQVIRRFVGHTNALNAVAFSHDGKTALSGSYDRTLIVWDAASGQLIRRFPVQASVVNAIAFRPDGKIGLSGMADGTLILWDLDRGTEIRRFAGHTGAVTSVAFSPDGKIALSGSLDQTLIVWDVASGQPIRHFVGHTGAINAVAFSPDGRVALSGSSDKSLRLWRIDTLEQLIAWTMANRGIPDLPCDQRTLYGVEPLCDGVSASPAPTP
jgi:WD40 repeat protein/transcriptional regulator with XRE-family HTH domain